VFIYAPAGSQQPRYASLGKDSVQMKLKNDYKDNATKMGKDDCIRIGKDLVGQNAFALCMPLASASKGGA